MTVVFGEGNESWCCHYIWLFSSKRLICIDMHIKRETKRNRVGVDVDRATSPGLIAIRFDWLLASLYRHCILLIRFCASSREFEVARPTLFLLWPGGGADPTKELEECAKTLSGEGGYKQLAMGQGQAAEAMR